MLRSFHSVWVRETAELWRGYNASWIRACKMNESLGVAPPSTLLNSPLNCHFTSGLQCFRWCSCLACQQMPIPS